MKKLVFTTMIVVFVFSMTACSININDGPEKYECDCEKNEPTAKIKKGLIGKEFTRTYRIEHVAESNEYEYLYITIRQFQSEEIETVKVNRKDFEDVKVEDYYEIKFEIKNDDIEDNIKSIFENTKVVKAEKTDKTGLQQINEDF